MSTNTEASTLIVRLAHVPFMDITGLQALDEALDVFRKHIKVMVCETNERVFRKLAKAGLVEKGVKKTFSELLLTRLNWLIMANYNDPYTQYVG